MWTYYSVVHVLLAFQVDSVGSSWFRHPVDLVYGYVKFHEELSHCTWQGSSSGNLQWNHIHTDQLLHKSSSLSFPYSKCTVYPIALTNVLQRSSPILLFNPLKIRLQRDTNEEVCINWLWAEPCHLVQSHTKPRKIWIPSYSLNQTGDASQWCLANVMSHVKCWLSNKAVIVHFL